MFLFVSTRITYQNRFDQFLLVVLSDELFVKAAIWTRYGGPEVLEIKEIERPAPSDHEVLVKIAKSTVTLGDCEIRGSYLPMWTRIPLRLYFGLFKPTRVRILGQECAGEIIEVGSKVTKFMVGDRVLCYPGISFGTYAQYITLNENSSMAIIHEIHPDLSNEIATTIPLGGVHGLYYIKKANLKKGDSILINGAGGSIGTYAIQVARLYGAHITVVDREEKFEMMQRLGASDCLDYRSVKFWDVGKKYDVIFDIVGKVPFRKVSKNLKAGGIYLTANPKPNIMIRSKIRSKLSDKTFITSTVSENSELIDHLMELISGGKVIPEIDKSYPLDAIEKAHRYVESGMKQGNVIIDIT